MSFIEQLSSSTSVSSATPPSDAFYMINALYSEHLQAVEQRIIRQLMQAIIYEDILPYTQTDLVQRTEYLQHQSPHQFAINGVTTDQQSVQYICAGKRMISFGRVRLQQVPVTRIAADGHQQVARLHEFLHEVLQQAQQGERLQQFRNELEQTLLKDLQSQADRQVGALTAEQRRYDELEGQIKDGHLYHPCYKSRIGFTLEDNAAYGPEFQQVLQPIWLAVAKECSLAAFSDTVTDHHSFMQEALSDKAWQQFESILQEQHLNIDDYHIIPVHPWQWKNKIVSAFYRELASQQIIPLGYGEDEYYAQQSIRTLGNRTRTEAPYLKMALSITNTSTARILAGHTVLNGALITDWLTRLIQSNETARQLGFVVLRERAGITFNYEKLPEYRKMQTYGSLGTIWRESLHTYLKQGEDGVPFNGLCHVQQNGVPFIDPWIQQYGLEQWTYAMLKATVTPIIHMLYAHGIGMESHGQNIILIHQNGLPVRIALKDFHDGVRFSVSHLVEPEWCPELTPEPASHAKINRNSFIKTDNPEDVRDFSYDAFFFIAATEMCMFLEQYYQLSEQSFWKMTADIIHQYQQEHPQHQERFDCFDLFAETVLIEELTKRRLFGDGELRFKDGINPLYAYRNASC